MIVQVGRLCTPNGGMVCRARWDAVREGTMAWSPQLNGWVLEDAPPRTRSWKTRYFHPPEDDAHGQPYVWADCPWCGGELPDALPMGPWIKGDG